MLQEVRQALEQDHTAFLAALREIVTGKRYSSVSTNLTYSQIKQLWLATDEQKQQAAHVALNIHQVTDTNQMDLYDILGRG
ncbi:hypothetical protein MH117_04985 [Paenibacillus sp. ACRRX]|uniref:hypothetical protein n=1 Tax=Paenibacillus sp. ACRRX TaxID=2918206 RepID=UPI001EF59AFA|nr:hypothetical protein [Paenibacillus sp. ACRRX]MCG7406765.1 hypothetical protein [Paenibacillus sp. ACRRX]